MIKEALASLAGTPAWAESGLCRAARCRSTGL